MARPSREEGNVFYVKSIRKIQVCYPQKAEQLELMRSAFQAIPTVRENTPVFSAMPSCRTSRLHGTSSGVQQPRRITTLKYTAARCGAESLTAVGLGGCMLPAAVTAGRGTSELCADGRQAHRR
jgi:transposase